MPIFEYICKGCGNKFEAIVYGSKQSECPVCKSTELAAAALQVCRAWLG